MKSAKHNLLFPNIIATKLHPPQVRTSIVHRSRLFEKIDSDQAKLILFAAPAGFGKSTLVLDWLNKKKCTFAWLSLDESDNDPRRFFQYFCTALQTAGIDFGDDLVAALKGSSIPSIDILVTQLINTLHAYSRQLTIVLDDYYFIEERTVHNAVNLLLDHLPVNIRLVISSRVDPLLPLHRMRAKGELTEIRERDLRFTLEEAHEFFNTTMRIELSEEDIEKLAARTEGWVAGLQLAAVSLHDVRDAREFIDSFTGTNRYVLDYLLEEVLNRQSKEVQMFLLQTSILKRFNEDLCNTITGGMNAGKILEYLERSNLFLIPLDDTREWFRYHHLFSELLQYRLRQLYPKLIDELHHNASVWFEEREIISESIEYVIRVKNFDRAAYLLDRYGVLFLSRSELSTLINYERKIPDTFKSQYPQLLITKAWALMLMHMTEDIDDVLSSVESLLAENKRGYTPEDILEARGHIATIRAFVLRLDGKLSESLEATMKVLQNFTSQNRMIRGLLLFNIGRVYMKQGFAEKAIATFNEGFDDNLAAGNYYVSLAILGHIGYLYSITESLPAARHKLEDALVYAEKHGIASLPAAGYIYYQLGRVLYHQNEFDKAINILEQAVRLGELGNEPDIICNALIMSSWIYAIKDDREKALHKFNRAAELEKNSKLSIYEADIEIERTGLYFLLNDLDTVGSWMNRADYSIKDEFTVIEESRILLMIRYLVRTEDYNKALRLSRKLRTECEHRGRFHTVLQLDVLDAVCLWETEKKNEAIQSFKKGIGKASEMGYIRVLLNIGSQLHPMLKTAQEKNNLPPVSRDLLKVLLPQSPPDAEIRHTAIPKFKQVLPDPLTEREQEVLFHISANLSNKEIAAKLFVSIDTIKTHLKNIYGKLGVNSRLDAVSKAKDKGLLE